MDSKGQPVNTKLKFAGQTDQGKVRTRNEDEWTADSELGLFLVADGMGGQSAGDLSAKVVSTSLPSMIRRNLDGITDLGEPVAAIRLVEIMAEFSGLVRAETLGEPGLKGMGSTVVVALIRDGKALIGHIGDSRMYLLRHGDFSRLTKDHSLVQILVDFGEITPEEAAVHPIRSQITQFVGMPGEAQPEVRLIELESGDRLLLCTDGLTEMLPDEAIAHLLKLNKTPEVTCAKLVYAANEAGGRDNITVLIVDWFGS